MSESIENRLLRDVNRFWDSGAHAQWIEPKYVKVKAFVRHGVRFLGNKRRNTLELANISIRGFPGGLGTQLLEKLEQTSGRWQAIYVESVMPASYQEFFEGRPGWRQVPHLGPPPSYWFATVEAAEQCTCQQFGCPVCDPMGAHHGRNE